MTYTKGTYQKYKESYAKSSKKSRLLNKEKHTEWMRNWRKANPEKVKATRSRNYQKNKEKINLRIRTWYRQIKLNLLKVYGGGKIACSNCGFEDADVLELDHINNDGKHERDQLKMSTPQFYRYLTKKNYPDKERYQVLCRNCNWKKHILKKRQT